MVKEVCSLLPGFTEIQTLGQYLGHFNLSNVKTNVWGTLSCPRFGLSVYVTADLNIPLLYHKILNNFTDKCARESMSDAPEF